MKFLYSLYVFIVFFIQIFYSCTINIIIFDCAQERLIKYKNNILIKKRLSYFGFKLNHILFNTKVRLSVVYVQFLALLFLHVISKCVYTMNTTKIYPGSKSRRFL